MTAHRLMLASFLAAGSIAFTAVPANAQTVRHHDTVHDVVKEADSSNGDFSQHVVAHRKQGDITWVRATYSKHSLFLSMRFRQLAKVRRTQLHAFEIRTSSGKLREALVRSGTKYPSGAAVLSNEAGYLHCHIQHRVSYRQALVTVTIPARCLGNARWVRVGYGEADLPRDPANVFASETDYSDDGYISGPALGDNEDLTFGPEVHRG